MKTIQASLAIATLLSLATCQDVCNHHADVGQDPSGNPLRQPGLDTQVPRGQVYQIKWDNTTSGTVSIALLRGPSSNAVESQCLANSIANTGTFDWTPSTSLQVDNTHYGLKIIVDATGGYQYSSQFGISQGTGGSSSGSPSSGIPSSSSPPSSSIKPSYTKKYEHHTWTGKPHTPSGSGYHYRPHNGSSIYNYHHNKTASVTKSPTATPPPATSVALVGNGGSQPGGVVSTQVVGVGAGGAGSGSTATATAQSPSTPTPSSFGKNSAASLEATSILLGGVAAIMFFLC